MASSTIRVVAEKSSVCTGDEFIAHVAVDAPDAINAVQGTLVYDSTQVTPVAIRYGDSFLRYWVMAPALPQRPGEIPFIGGVPYPGFQGEGGRIMSIIFRADASGANTRLFIRNDASILLNDGQGTSTQVSYKDQSVAVIEQSAIVCETSPTDKYSETDTTAPLPFDIVIDRSEKIFNNHYFAVFDTTDTETGVSYYEVRESSAYIHTSWLKAESPYQLMTQGGEVMVEVRAIDGAGNTRDASSTKTLEARPAAMATGDMLLIGTSAILGVIIWMICRKNKE